MKDKLVELIAKYFEKLNPNSNHIIATQLAGYLRNNGVTFAPDNNVGCKYCEEYEDLPEHCVDGMPVGRVFDTCIQHDGVSWHLEPASGCDIGIMFCPMCGRLLPEPPKEGE